VSALSYTITVKENESECLYEEFSRDSLLPDESQETVSTEVSIAFTVKNLMYMRATFNSVISVNVTDPHGNLLFEKSPVTEEVLKIVLRVDKFPPRFMRIVKRLLLSCVYHI
jgi:hypothetical protein